MSEVNWDEVLGGVEEDEKENPSKGGNFEPLPDGPYVVVVQEAEKQVSRNTGKDMIKTRVQVAEGPYANRVLFKYIVFSTENPKAMRITLDQLAAFGVTRDFVGTTKPSVGQIAELLVGRKAKAIVGTQKEGEYAGNNEIKSFRALEGVEQPAPVAAAPKQAGVPTLPTQPAAPAATPTPDLPTPDVSAGEAPVDPFGD